jgi:hypothetical protein
MFVQGLGPAFQTELKPDTALKDKAAGNPKKKSLFAVSDSFEPSDTPERKAFIQSVRNKIRSGFYNTEPVLEDLSHGFAQVLNQIQ